MMCGASSQFLVFFGMLVGLLSGIGPVANSLAAQETGAAKQKPTAVAGSEQSEKILSIFPLKYVPSEVLVRTIQGAGLDCNVTIDAARKRVIALVSRSDQMRMMELIKQIDVPPSPELVEPTKIFRLVNAQAHAMLPIIASVIRGEVQLAADQRTNSLLAVGPEDKLKVVEAMVTRLDEISDRDLPLAKKTYRVHIAWFAEGPPSDKAVKINEDLQPVLAELSRIGIDAIRQVGQTIVSATPQGRFSVGCSAALGDGPADLVIQGELDIQQEAPHLKIEISAKRNQALEDANTGTTKRVELVHLATEIVAPLDHYVVLGVTPTQEKTLAFVVQVRSGD